MKKAVVLLSGGMDSATALYLAKSQGYELYALSFEYGQRHLKELDFASALAKKAKVKEHIIIKTGVGAWGGSALTDMDTPVPDGTPDKDTVPVTYVPARNMVFLAYGASYAETTGAQDIYIGVSQVDYSGYVDCRKVFIDAMEKAINLGTVCAAEHNKKISIHAPFIYMKKSDEIKLGLQLGLDYKDTWTCYKGGEYPCGICDSCMLRIKAFEEAGLEDPLEYKGGLIK